MNIVKVTGPQDAVIVLYNFMKTENNPFDFNRVFKMPEDLLAEYHQMVIEDVKQYVRSGMTSDVSPFTIGRNEEFKKLLSLYEKYGHCCACDWAIDKWGVKWNSYSHGECAPGRYQFLTANGCADNVFIELSKLFPDVTIEVKFSNEDQFGWQGTITYSNGVMTEKQLELESEEAIKFHDEVWGLS